MKNQELVRVELKFGNGTVKYLDDPAEIKKWLARIDQGPVMRKINGQEPEEKDFETWKLKMSLVSEACDKCPLKNI